MGSQEGGKRTAGGEHGSKGPPPALAERFVTAQGHAFSGMEGDAINKAVASIAEAVRLANSRRRGRRAAPRPLFWSGDTARADTSCGGSPVGSPLPSTARRRVGKLLMREAGRPADRREGSPGKRLWGPTRV